MTEREESINFFEDSGSDSEPVAPAATLERLTDLTGQARGLEVAMVAKQMELDDLTKKYLKIVRDLIPTIMDELGLENYKLKDGSKVEVKDDVKCTIPEENRPAAWSWLEEKDYDGIIKTLVTISFGKGEIDVARKAMQQIAEIGFTPALDRHVHPQTLKAFVKERLEEGEALPLDIFSIFQFKQAKITLPKPTSKASRRSSDGENEGNF